MAHIGQHDDVVGAASPQQAVLKDRSIEQAVSAGMILFSALVFVAPTLIGFVFAREARSLVEPEFLGQTFPFILMWLSFDFTGSEEVFFALPILVGVLFGSRPTVQRFAVWIMLGTLVLVAIGGTAADYFYPEPGALRNAALTVGVSADAVAEAHGEIHSQIEATRAAAIAFLAGLGGLVLTRSRSR